MDGEHKIQKAYESILGHDFESAIEWFEKAIEAEPENAAYHYKLSITYARSNKLLKAIELAKKALFLQPDSEQYRFHLQNLHARELIFLAEKCFGQTEEQLYAAVTYLKDAIKLDPLALEAYLILGEAYASLKDYHSAVHFVQEALKLDPMHELAKRQLNEYRHKLNQWIWKPKLE